MVVQVPQVDEEDESTGFLTNSPVVTLWPPNKDEGDADNDDLEWDDADLMRRRKLTFGYQKWLWDRRNRRVMRRMMRVQDEEDDEGDEEDDEGDEEDADYNLLEWSEVYDLE